MRKARKAIVPVQYYVEWHPTDIIEAECIKQGMKPDDGTSFWDWVEIPDHATSRIFQTFDEAVAFALTIAENDCFGGARIYRQEQVVVKRGLRAFIEWQDECFWDGINGRDPADNPDINTPDEYCS